MDNDKLVIGGHEFDSRFILGSGKYSLSYGNEREVEKCIESL